MARPLKEGLDYFPIDINMFSDKDDKTSFLEAKYGLEGIGLIVKLFQRIYGGNGYYKNWGEREVLLFSKQTSVAVEKINEFIEDCINEGLFNREMYDNYKILTSSGIQKRYFKACSRRSKTNYDPKYLLVDPEEDKKPPKKKTTPVNVFSFYQKNIGFLSEFQAEFIESFINDGMTEDTIIEVIKDSLGKPHPWGWIKKVLEDLLKNNVKTLEQYTARKIEFKRQQESKKLGDKPKNQTPAANKGNFEQRNYSEDFYENLYENL